MKKDKFRSILAGILVGALLLGLLAGIIPVLVSAEDYEGMNSAQVDAAIDELKEQRDAIDEEIAALEAKISANMDEMEAIVAQKNVIDQQVFLLFEQVENINSQITAYSALIADKQDELDAAKNHLEDLQEKNKERIRAMEKNGKLSYWSVIFQANNFADLLDRLKMVQEIAEADKRRMEEMSQAAEVVAAAKTELEAEKVDLEQTKEELAVTQTELDAKREQADELLSALVAKGEEYEALVHESEEDRAEIQMEILEAEEAYDAAKEKEYQEWLAQNPPGGTGGTPNNVGGITWLIPISYTHFSSPFGYRIHPIHGDWRFHYGVDLSAPEGTPIYASRSGVVNVAAYEAGGAGYYVNIDHKDGFMTRYMHMTHFIVSPGQYVYAGQVIGYCGSTGGSTGPHLHFGVYYNGVAVNPADYISI